MTPVVFMGNPRQLEAAYPLHLRLRVQELGRIAGPVIPTAHWRSHAGALREAEVILSTWGMPRMDAEFLEACPRLRAVFYAAGTVKDFVTPEAFERGIVVCSARGANAVPVAEYATAVTLLSLKKFWFFARETRGASSWPTFPEVPGGYHSTVGLVSLGAAGRQTAEVLSRFDLNLLAYDPYISAAEARALNVRLVDLEDIFRLSNVVSLHAPWVPETENLIGASLLRLMKPGASLINTARGAIVDEEALCTVLKERPDLTAILDVTHPEPPPCDSDLYHLDNVIVTPHIAGSLGGEIARMGSCMVDELARFVSGDSLRYQVEEAMLERLA